MNRILALIGLAAAALARPAYAQRTEAQANALCAPVLQTRGLQGATCRSLATQIVDRVTEKFYRPEPRDLQNTGARPATGGSLAQAEAVPSAEPLAVGGASLSAVGTDSGAKTIVALTINPAIFLTSPRDPEAITRATRIADLTLLLPVDDLDRDEDGKVDYLGARLRLNLTGAASGGRVLAAGNAFLRNVQVEADMINRMIAAFQRAGDVGACAGALLEEETDPSEVSGRCGGEVDLRADPALYQDMRDKMAEARAEADSRYLGLDLRADFGDPTLGAVANASATAINAGLAWGRRLVGGDPLGTTAGLKARGGLRYTHLRDLGTTGFAFDGGLGFEVRRPLDESTEAVVSAGFEFRYGGEAGREDELQTNYTVFRAALTIPLAGATALSLAVGAPLDGPIAPTLSVNFNWSLLLPKLGFAPSR